jgi:hypothetical protein
MMAVDREGRCSTSCSGMFDAPRWSVMREARLSNIHQRGADLEADVAMDHRTFVAGAPSAGAASGCDRKLEKATRGERDGG